jgi:hypothetical protein
MRYMLLILKYQRQTPLPRYAINGMVFTRLKNQAKGQAEIAA